MDPTAAIKQLIAAELEPLRAEIRELRAQLASAPRTGTMQELAEDLGVSSRSLYALMKGNPLPADARRKVGGRYVYDFEKMRAWFWECGEW